MVELSEFKYEFDRLTIDKKVTAYYDWLFLKIDDKFAYHTQFRYAALSDFLNHNTIKKVQRQKTAGLVMDHVTTLYAHDFVIGYEAGEERYGSGQKALISLDKIVAAQQALKMIIPTTAHLNELSISAPELTNLMSHCHKSTVLPVVKLTSQLEQKAEQLGDMVRAAYS